VKEDENGRAEPAYCWAARILTGSAPANKKITQIHAERSKEPIIYNITIGPQSYKPTKRYTADAIFRNPQ
jgi:hypothetical protein